MTRLVALVSLVVVGALSSALAAARQPAVTQAKVIEVEKLHDNLFVLRGGGGNSAVFVTAKGVVVVDTKIPGWGQPLLDKIKELTNRPVTTIINTHTHFDHVSGNVEFPPTVDVIAHENTKANMVEMRSVTGFKPEPGATNIFTEHKGRGLPRLSFKETMSIGRGGDQVDLHYFGRGHTDGDAWVVFPSLRVAHAGDIVSGKNLPLLDANNGGSGVVIGDTLAKAAAGLTGVDSIITGHSKQMTMAELEEYAVFNKEFLAAVQAGRKAGQSADGIAASWTMPAKYTGYAAPTPARLKSNIEVILNETK